MKIIFSFHACLFFLLLHSTAAASESRPVETWYYSYNIEGKPYKYTIVEVFYTADKKTRIEQTERKIPSTLDDVLFKELTEVYHVDPGSGKIHGYEIRESTGSGSSYLVAKFSAREVRFTTRGKDHPDTLSLSPEVVVQDPFHFQHLLEDPDLWTDNCRTFNLLDFECGEIVEKTYTNKKKEMIQVGDQQIETMAFDWIEGDFRTKGTIWIESVTGRLIRSDFRKASSLVQIDVETATWYLRAHHNGTSFPLNKGYLKKQDQPINDHRKLTYMKVDLAVDLSKGNVTSKSLNLPGQKFTGTVENGKIKGTFETTLTRYMGDAALPYPLPDLTINDSFRPYLRPEAMIESDREAVLDQAIMLTRGARHAWDAATRLSAWVGDKISFEPYDGSALETLESLEGEARAQARLLTALARAVGIPARVVTGLLYTHHFGGFFSEHHWTELYMGEAGWIAVDTAAWEIDYIDAGHIRLGEGIEFQTIVTGLHELSTGERPSVESAPSSEFHPIVWSADRAATFDYLFKGKDLGTSSYQVERIEMRAEDKIYHCTTTLDFRAQRLKGSWELTDKGRPLRYQVGGKVSDYDYGLDCVFHDDRVEMKIQQAEASFNETVPLKGPVRLVDYNNISLYEFFLSGLSLRTGARFAFDVFYPSSMETISLKIKVEREEQIVWHEEQIICHVLALDLDGAPIRLWVDGKGRILQGTEQNGRLMMIRQP